LTAMVTLLWCLDTLHVAFAAHALYWYLIVNAASQEATALIIWSLPTTIAITAAITFIVQLFFAHRIFKLSKRHRWIAVLIVITATARLAFGTVTTTKAIILGNFAAFQPLVRFLVTTGLTLSVVTDLMITVTLCLFLGNHRTGFETDNLIDKVIRWTIQTGAITTFFGMLSMICAIVMPHNLIWIGVHMIISKLYTTMTIAHLNSRELARDQRAREAENTHGLKLRNFSNHGSSDKQSGAYGAQVSIHVQRDVYVDPVDQNISRSSMDNDSKDISYLGKSLQHV